MQSAKLAVRWLLGWLGRGRSLITAVRTWFVRTDVRRWKRVATEIPRWDARNQIIASLVPAGASVLDLGCGAQTLRAHLKPGCHYQPCDIVASSEDVIICDFNSGKYPVLLGSYDFVICSGVFEYIRDPGRFIQETSQYGRIVLFSFNPSHPAQSMVDRLARGWVNHLTQAGLERLLSDNGLSWQIVQRETKSPTVEELIYEIRSTVARNC